MAVVAVSVLSWLKNGSSMDTTIGATQKPSFVKIYEAGRSDMLTTAIFLSENIGSVILIGQDDGICSIIGRTKREDVTHETRPTIEQTLVYLAVLSSSEKEETERTNNGCVSEVEG